MKMKDHPEIESKYYQFEMFLTQTMSSESVYNTLKTMAWLRRAGLRGPRLEAVRYVEVRYRENIEKVVGLWFEFMKSSTLLERLPKLYDALKKVEIYSSAEICDYYTDRDDAELVYNLIFEYLEEEKVSKETFAKASKVRFFLDEVDTDIFLRYPSIADEMRNIGEMEKEFVYTHDKDFFWWLQGKTDGCFIPEHRRDEYLHAAICGQSYLGWAKHKSLCEYCRDTEKELRRDFPIFI